MNLNNNKIIYKNKSKRLKNYLPQVHWKPLNSEWYASVRPVHYSRYIPLIDGWENGCSLSSIDCANPSIDRTKIYIMCVCGCVVVQLIPLIPLRFPNHKCLSNIIFGVVILIKKR